MVAVTGQSPSPYAPVSGMSPAGTGATQDLFGSLEEAGVTWWQECTPWDERLDRVGPMLR
jgi:hypothetical protein